MPVRALTFPWLIDLHCHVLPGIDDGPKTIDDAVALARVCANAGVEKIVATPHVSWRYQNDHASIEPLVQALNLRLAAEGIETEILPGAEIAATRVAELQPHEIERLTLGDGGWVLLEPPFTTTITGFDQIAYTLMGQGHRVLIAHPERCPAFHRDIGMLRDLVGAGAATSITAGSLAGRFGGPVQRLAMRLFAQDLAHNVASDAHDAFDRPPGVAAEIARAGLGELREWLTELVPAAILGGAELPSRPPGLLVSQNRRRLRDRLWRSRR